MQITTIYKNIKELTKNKQKNYIAKLNMGSVLVC